MLKGVWINGVSTISSGFILLSDLVIGTAEPKRSTVDIPGADGVIDNSFIYGRPIYNNRTIRFRLFCKADEATWETRRKQLFKAYHGQRVRLTLPQDVPDADPYEVLDDPVYWDGVLSFGDTAGYAGGVLPVTVDCAPYQLVPNAPQSQVLSSALGSTSWTVSLYNEGDVPSQISITVTQDVNLTFVSEFTGTSATITLTAGTHDTQALYVRGLCVDPGRTDITFSVRDASTVTCTVMTAERRL